MILETKQKLERIGELHLFP